MIDAQQFRINVVRPALSQMGMWSEAAENLVVGTAYQESRLKYIKQLGGGPALGLFQIEPATHTDLYVNFLDRRSGLANLLIEIKADKPSADSQLVSNLMYAAAVCRLIYYRRPEPLPDQEDIEGLGEYWKLHYNTSLGRGTASEWVENYRKLESM